MSDTHLKQLRDRFGARYRWYVTFTAMVGTMAMTLSSTIINVALPEIMLEFGVGHSQVQWLATAFLASMTVGMLVNAWCVNTFGLRKTYLGAMLAFLAASGLGGIAPSFELLVASRVLQGLMAGLIQPLALLIIYHVFPVNERGKAMGIYGMGVIIGPTVGPVLGGVMVDLVSWRAVFLVVVPVVFGGVLMALRFLARPETSLLRRRLDVGGLLLLVVWLTTLLWVLANGPLHGWSDMRVLAGITIGVLAFISFVALELRRAEPLMAMAVFRLPGFTGAFIVSMVTGAALFTSVYLLPLLAQKSLGFSSTDAGLLLVPAGLVMAMAFPLIGRMADMYGPLWLVGGGLAVFAVSCLLLGISSATGTFFWVATWGAIGRIGIALMMPSVVVGTLRLLPETLVNQGAGVISFARQFGGAVGVSVAAMVLQEQAAIFAFGSMQDAVALAYRDAFFLLGLLAVLGAWPLRAMVRRGRDGAEAG